MWTCNDCHAGFRAPKLWGAEEDYDAVCPECLSLDIKHVESVLDPDVFFSEVK